MGKVPAIRDGDALVTEQGAVYLYLADLFQDAGLSPQMGDPLDGPYLRWLFFYGSSFEPAVVDRAGVSHERTGGADRPIHQPDAPAPQIRSRPRDEMEHQN